MIGCGIGYADAGWDVGQALREQLQLRGLYERWGREREAL